MLIDYTSSGREMYQAFVLDGLQHRDPELNAHGLEQAQSLQVNPDYKQHKIMGN